MGDPRGMRCRKPRPGSALTCTLPIGHVEACDTKRPWEPMTDAERDFWDAADSRARARVDEAVARLAWALVQTDEKRAARVAFHQENVLHEVDRLSLVRHRRDVEEGGPSFRDTARGRILWSAAQAQGRQRDEADAKKGAK